MEDICRRGVNYHPEELAYSFYLAVALSQQEQTAEAREALLQGLRARNEDSSPQLLSDMYALLGDLYARQELTEQAFEAYDSALVYVEDNISCLNNYAYYLSLRGERLDEAEEMSYRTLKAEP
jgi:tetratricopeptide (TPR) repeat protein